MKRAIDKLRDLVREERYQISIHANEEMANDLLEAIDIENTILTGSITKGSPETHEERDTKLQVKRVTVARWQLFVGLLPPTGLQ